MTQERTWYDVIVVGAGPAGLFAVKRLLEHHSSISVLMLESGPKTDRRKCPAEKLLCKDCKVCTIISGMGGGGLHSDGKLVLDLNAGGHLGEVAGLSDARKRSLVDEIRRTLTDLGTKAEIGPRLASYDKKRIIREFSSAGFELSLYDVVHLGTADLEQVTVRLIDNLHILSNEANSTFKVETRNPMISVAPIDDGFELKTRRGLRYARNAILAVGKSGAPQMRTDIERLGVTSLERPAWVGIRVQVPADSVKSLLALSFDPKISRVEETGRRVKTHCFCRDGSLLVYKYRGGYLVGGHSKHTRFSRDAGPVAGVINFNVLASVDMASADVDDFLKLFSRASGPAVAVQDMKSFLDPASPLADVDPAAAENATTADIRALLDRFDGVGKSLASFLEDLGKRYPGIVGDRATIFAPALEWDYGTLNLAKTMETSVPGLYAVGDGAGVSQGVVHAAASGIVAADDVCTRLEASRGLGAAEEAILTPGQSVG